MSFVTIWMDLKGIILSELSQTEQVKFSALSVTQNLENLKKMCITKQSLPDIENKS